MVYKRYDELEVYKLAYKLAISIHKHSWELPQHEQMRGIADQLRRATTSVCANIAEGLGKEGTPVEEKRFLSIALGSVEEIRVWLSFCKDFGYWPETYTEKMKESYIEVSKMLAALKRKRT